MRVLQISVAGSHFHCSGHNACSQAARSCPWYRSLVRFASGQQPSAAALSMVVWLGHMDASCAAQHNIVPPRCKPCSHALAESVSSHGLYNKAFEELSEMVAALAARGVFNQR